MKILFFINSLTAGGKERRFSELLKGLNKNSEVSFEIVVMNRDIHYKEIFSLDSRIHYLIRNTKKDLSVFKKFYRICKEYKPDLVHTWDGMTSVIAIPACRLLNIIFVNGMVVDTPVKRNISNKYWLRAQLTFPFSKKIIGNSKAGLMAYGASAQKSQCIYNGMDFNRFINLRDPPELLKEIFGDVLKPVFIIGMVAAFEPRKDYDTLITAAISLINQNKFIRFILVGEGSQIDELKSKIPKNLKNKIIFSGRRDDVESIINLFDIGVLLTNTDNHGEGISNSIIEYMALGKPVIATIGGGTNEVILDNENGFLIKNRDVNQFIDKVQKLIENPELCIKFGEKGRKIALSTFNLELMTERYLSLYQNLMPEEVS